MRGWTIIYPYGLTENIFGGGQVKASYITLPQISVKPYIQYGVGLQKSWGERFTAYGQVMMRHGGRNGIAASAGFRWILGSSKDKKEKDVKNINNKIKTQKQLNTTQITPVEEIKPDNLKPITTKPVVQPAPQQEIKPIKDIQVDNNNAKIAEPAPVEVILNQTAIPEVKVIKTDNKVPEIQKPVAFELEEKNRNRHNN